MEEPVKNIISRYTGIPVEQINTQTVIDRSVVNSSIVLHRMYAQLATEGFAANNYTEIQTYGHLMSSLNNGGAAITSNTTVPVYQYSPEEQSNAVGIDAEAVSALPQVSDFRSAEFYTMNFAAAEISYCLLQTDPYASFAGLFAAKEAIIKADNAFKNTPFNAIVIDHLPSGKPVYQGFHLSISHTGDLAIAVAVKASLLPANLPSGIIPPPGSNKTLLSLTATAALLLSLLSLLLFLYKNC